MRFIYFFHIFFFHWHTCLNFIPWNIQFVCARAFVFVFPWFRLRGGMMGQKWGPWSFISTPSGSSPHIMYWFFFFFFAAHRSGCSDRQSTEAGSGECVCVGGGITDLGEEAWQVDVSQPGLRDGAAQDQPAGTLFVKKHISPFLIVCRRECNGKGGGWWVCLGPSCVLHLCFHRGGLLSKSLQILTVKDLIKAKPALHYKGFMWCFFILLFFFFFVLLSISNLNQFIFFSIPLISVTKWQMTQYI